MSLPTTIFNPKIPTSLHTHPPSQNFTPQKIQILSKNINLNSLKTSSLPSTFNFTAPQQTDNLNDNKDDDEQPIGDCVVFEEGIFEDPFARNELGTQSVSKSESKSKPRKKAVQVREENLVPEEWREVQAELNMSKKDRRKIAREVEFGSRVLRRKKGLIPLRDVNLEEYMAFREAKLRMLKPVELDDLESEDEDEEMSGSAIERERVEPKNPKWAVYGRGLDDVTAFFNSGGYVPGEDKPQGRQKLFTKEEKVQLNRKIPDLAPATSKKWLPLHALAASGEFYLTDALLKHNVDINAADKDGLTALHKAIIGKKQAITNYLLRESADPFVRDKDGATLLHYAVQTASSQAIKVLLLYNVDINLQDNDGWTPLHLAVQGRRTDVVRLLLIKGADKTLKNRDGLTPLDLCLYSGRDARTYELIKLLKTLPRSYTVLPQTLQS